MTDKRGGIALTDLVRWLCAVLVRMSRERAWGKIEITIQAGQIEFVLESRNYRDRLPQAGTEGQAEVKQVLAAAS